MKKLIILLFAIFWCAVSFGQTYPITQNIGSTSTLLDIKGGGRVGGAFVLGHYQDTSAANAVPYVKNYANGLITTDTNRVWLRTYNAQKWIQLIANDPTPTGDTLYWSMSGNSVASRSAAPKLGLNSADNLNIVTDGTVRLVVPSSGITRNMAAVNKYLLYDTLTKAMYYGDGSSGGSGWSLTGNSGTTAGTNFIGTTDNTAFVFKTNNQFAGFLNPQLSNGSTSFGAGSMSLAAITTDYNTAFGSFNLPNVTSGSSQNTAVGTFNLYNNTDGYDNIAIGNYSLYSNETGFGNIGIGVSALSANDSYGGNIGIGSSVLRLATAAFNTSVGYFSMSENTTGEQNSAFGTNALKNNTIGIKNQAFGAGSLENNTTGSFNNGIGHDALLQNTTGIENVGVGWLGWSQNRTGNYNVGVGNSSGRSVVNGSYNTSLGASSMYSGTQEDTVSNTIALGFNSYTTRNYQFALTDSAKSFTFRGISRGVAGYVMTDSLGNGEYWVARPNAALSLGLQDVITNDPVLTTSNTIDGGGNTLVFDNNLEVNINANKTSSSTNLVQLQANTTGGRASKIKVSGDSLIFNPGLGNFYVDTLNSSANASDSMLVWNKSTGIVGIRSIPSTTADFDWDVTDQFIPTLVTPFSYYNSGAGSGTALSLEPSNSGLYNNGYGWLKLATGTTSSGYAGFRTSNSDATRFRSTNGGTVTLQFDNVGFGTLSDGTDTYTIYIGSMPYSTNAEPSNGLYFKYTHSVNSGNWTCVNANGGSRTSTNSTVAVAANTVYDLRISVTSGTATFSINGTTVATQSTNFPDNVAMQPWGGMIVKSAGTSDRDMWVDAVRLRYQ